MTAMITRCPSCETSFRITEAQLSTAKGSVRCGSCLQIFRAMDNLISPRPETANTSAAPAQSGKARPEMPKFEYKKPAGSANPPISEAHNEPLPEPEAHWQQEEEWQYGSDGDDFAGDVGQENMLRFDQTAIDAADSGGPDGVFADDDLLISDEMPLDGETPGKSKQAYGDGLSESFLDLDSWQPAEKSLFDREAKPAAHGDDDNAEEPDESWAIDLLEEDDEDPVSFAPPKARPSEPEPPAPAFEQLEIEEPADNDEGYEHYSRGTTGSFSALDDDDVEESLGAPLSEKGNPAFGDTEDEDEDYADAYDFMDGDYADDGDRSELLSRIEPAPVEFAFYQGRDWRKRLLWGGMAALGLLLLVGQVAWLQFESLSRTQPYRDIYGAFCPLLGCELPSLAAPDLIRTSNLVVRSHPEADGALMVDTILLNTASFQQPFPDLVLSFSDIHGETLAARRFSPQEYLAGELAGRTEMPSNQPVHLSLEIVDPGPNAVNYSAYIPQ